MQQQYLRYLSSVKDTERTLAVTLHKNLHKSVKQIQTQAEKQSTSDASYTKKLETNSQTTLDKLRAQEAQRRKLSLEEYRNRAAAVLVFFVLF